MVRSDCRRCGMGFQMMETSFCLQNISHGIENQGREIMRFRIVDISVTRGCTVALSVGIRVTEILMRICGLFYDAVVTLIIWRQMIGWQMNWSGFERKR